MKTYILPECTFRVTVRTAEGYFELLHKARSVKETREWAAKLVGVLEVVQVTI
jgi:hypothetical protein